MGLLQLGIDPTSLAVLAFAAWGAFQAYKIIYRLYFHPLAHFPGPKFAAVSFLYEIYFDLLVAPGGQFIYRLDELHDKYGPVIRCSPEEIHVRDSQWFDTLYTGPGHVRSKWSKSIRANGSPGSVASAESHDLHRERRAALNPFFSKRAVDEVELSIRSKVEKMCQKFHDCAKERKIVELGTAFTAVTLDVITEYCYNNCFDVLSEPDFAPRWKQLMVGLFESATAMKHFPVVLQVLKTLPAPVLKILNPQLTLWVEAQHVIQGQARRVWSEESKAGRIQPVARGEERAKTVFHGMLQSNLSNEEKRMQRMADEAFVLIVAGAETTAKVITVTLAYLLEDEVLCARLRNALVEKMQAGLPSSRELEDIPLMKAIVQEGLRISAAVANRQILIAPDEHLQCQDWTIPSGTPTSMTLQNVLYDPDIFPDPHRFEPDRWLRAAERGERLDRYLVSFQKGKRACLGMNLAYAEIYLAVAALVSRFDLKLVDFDRRRDLDTVRDCFVGLPSKESRGLRVIMKEIS